MKWIPGQVRHLRKIPYPYYLISLSLLRKGDVKGNITGKFLGYNLVGNNPFTLSPHACFNPILRKKGDNKEQIS